MKKKACSIFAALLALQALPAATLTWTGTTSGAWDTATPANWNGIAPVFDNTADAVFDGGTPIVNYVTFLGGAARTVRSISVQGALTSPLEIRTNQNNATARVLTLSAAGGSALLTIASIVDQAVLIGQGTGTNANGSLSLASDLLITHDGTGPLVISRPVNEATVGSSITKTGGGTLVLAAAGNTTGPITVNDGTFQIGNGGTAGNVSGPVVNNATVVANRSDSVTLATVISGTGTFTQAGTGTTILSADNTYTGLTTVSSGLLQVGSTTAGSIAGDLLNNAAVDFNRSTDLSYSAVISGTGVVSKRGSGTLRLGGANSFSGGLNLYYGTVIAGDANIGTGPVTLGPALGNASTFSITGGTVDNDIIFSNGGTGNKVVNLATGFLDATLSGTIHLDADSASNAGVSRISPANGTIVISGKMTGTGLAGYSKRQTGTVIITNTTNDYTGPTHVVDAGTLLVNGRVPGSVYFGEALGVGGTGNMAGTLGGSGFIAGNVKLYAASKLSPGGASASGLNTDTQATLTIGGNLDASLTATGAGRFIYQLGSFAGPSDRINVGGTLSIGSGIFGLTQFTLSNAGGLQTGSYTLVSTAGGITGTLNPADLTGQIAPGLTGTLSISGNDLVLAVTPTSPYATWAAGFPSLTNTNFGYDFDQDGIPTGLEWVLGGNPTANDAAAFAPVTTGSASSGLTLTFNRRQESIGVATLIVEYGTDPGNWTGSATIGAASSGPDANGVSVTVTPATDLDGVIVNIPASSAGNGKLFARLRATLP